jgi:hypothetical protein
VGQLFRDFRGTVAGFEDGDYYLFLTFFVVVGAVAFWRAFQSLRITRLVEDMPTSRTRSAPQGYVELAGRASLMPGPDILTPMTGRRCVWWSLTTEELKNDRWQSVDREVSHELFHLTDETGTCIVDPEGARVSPAHKVVSSSGKSRGGLGRSRFRHTERYIKDGDQLYVIGEHRTFASDSNWNHADELREKLRAWKRDQYQLLLRFDANRDGKIDAQEWETARKEARREVEAEHREASVSPGVNVIGAPDSKLPFLIAAQHEDLVARRMRVSALLAAIVSAIAGILVILTLAARL